MHNKKVRHWFRVKVGLVLRFSSFSIPCSLSSTMLPVPGSPAHGHFADLGQVGHRHAEQFFRLLLPPMNLEIPAFIGIYLFFVLFSGFSNRGQNKHLILLVNQCQMRYSFQEENSSLCVFSHSKHAAPFHHHLATPPATTKALSDSAKAPTLLKVSC